MPLNYRKTYKIRRNPTPLINVSFDRHIIVRVLSPKTLSAADAAAHLLGNPLYAQHAPGGMQRQIGVTMFLLLLLAALFLKGYVGAV